VPPPTAISLIDLPHDVINEIVRHLQPAEQHGWVEVQDQCFVHPPWHGDLEALSSTCRALRRLFDEWVKVVCVESMRKDMRRTLTVLSEEKRWHVRYA
jgi:hypothetical protein